MLSHWTQDDLLIDGVRLHYYRTGHGHKRPLVLVHGFSDNGLCWARTARDLEFEYDVIMPDMRAHGLSARVQATDKVDMAADLAGTRWARWSAMRLGCASRSWPAPWSLRIRPGG
jgi:N-formylmaleamate deformylase